MPEDPAVYRDFQQRGGIADLSARVKLLVTGRDAARFLNGQVTSNVQKLAAGEAQRACVTTAKGKLCAEVVITATPGGWLVDADPSLVGTLAARLERYIISDDVSITDRTEDLRLLHIFGPGETAGQTAFDPTLFLFPTPPNTPAKRESERDSAGSKIEQALAKSQLAPARSQRFGHPGTDLFLTRLQFEKFWPELSAAFAVPDEPLCELLRIEAGVPRWGRELDENTLPPEAGLDRTHIDFHKGCYIGQEVISRLRSVGHVNRQLTGFVSESGAPLVADAPVFAPGEDARAAGVLTSAAFSFALEKWIALGYLRRGSPAHGLVARAADSPPVGVGTRELPFLK